MKTYLTTERMYLREITPEDEENLLDLDSDPEVMRYLTGGKPSPREEVRAGLMRIQGLYEKHQGRYGIWAAIEKETGRFMGWFLFRPARKDPDNTNRIEIGYRLKKMFWGKGFATEGSRHLVAKGFKEYLVPEIFAIAMKDNRASRNVMEKLGLKYTHEYPDEDFDGETIVEYSLSSPS